MVQSAMAMSRARRIFRGFLGFVLILSMGFFLTSVFFYAGVKRGYIKVADISVPLFEIDILQHRAMMAFTDQDGQFKIAEKMVRNSFFHPVYARAGLEMLESLADQGHAPSQMYYADLITTYKLKSPEDAEALYRAAAAQGYKPAEEKLAALDFPL